MIALDRNNKDLKRSLQDHTDDVVAVQFSDDGRLLLSASSDCTSRIWKTHPGRPAVQYRTLQHDEPVSCISCTSTKNSRGQCYVATAGASGQLSVWAISLNQSVLGSGGTALNCLPHKEVDCHDDAVWSCAFNPTREDVVATASSDGTVRTWDWSRGDGIAIYEGHMGWVTSVAYNRDASLLCSTSRDQSVRVWDAFRPGSQVMELWGHDSWVSTAAFTPTSESLFSASHDKTVRQWDLASGQEVAKLHGHEASVSALDISGDGEMMATTSWDGTCRLWSLRMRRILCALPIAAFAAQSSGWEGIAAAKGLAVAISADSDIAVGYTGGGLTMLEPPSEDAPRPEHTARHLSSPEPRPQTQTQEQEQGQEEEEEEEKLSREAEEEVCVAGVEEEEEEEGRRSVVDGRLVDQLLSLHSKTPHIAQYMDQHCSHFTTADPASLPPQQLHGLHEGYIDHVLNFMQDVCQALDIVYDDMVAAVTLLSKRPGPEPKALVLQMDAVEDASLFCALMHQRRVDLGVGMAQISDDEGDGDEEEEAETAAPPPPEEEEEEEEVDEEGGAISPDEGSVEGASALAELPSIPPAGASGQEPGAANHPASPAQAGGHGPAAATGPAGTPQGISAIFTSSRYGHTDGIRALLASNSRAVEQSKIEGVSMAERWRERHVGKRLAWEQAAPPASAQAGGSWEEVRDAKGGGERGGGALSGGGQARARA